MLQLVWRATFIDVAEEEQVLNSRRRSRAGSEPCLRGRRSNMFDDERAYVEGLCERISQTAAAHATSIPEPEVSSRLCSESVARRLVWAEVEEEDAEASPALFTPKPAACNPKSNVAVSSMLLRAKVEGKSGGALADEVTREPSSSDMSLASDAQSLADIAIQTQTSLSNTGSVGHPILCSRPCLYFATNDCANGAKCEFCHMEHSKRMPHLNKVHRDRLRDMEPSRAKILLLPLVREKALAFDNSARTANAVDRLVRACGVSGPDRVRRSREEQSLSKVLNGMTVRLLLIILERSVLQNEPEAQASAEALLTHLRGTVVGASARR